MAAYTAEYSWPVTELKLAEVHSKSDGLPLSVSWHEAKAVATGFGPGLGDPDGDGVGVGCCVGAVVGCDVGAIDGVALAVAVGVAVAGAGVMPAGVADGVAVTDGGGVVPEPGFAVGVTVGVAEGEAAGDGVTTTMPLRLGGMGLPPELLHEAVASASAASPRL